MFMGKIGNKSAAFINHKPFHPGNLQNLEKVWLAEQKHKEELKKQKELQERRAEEVKIEQLRRALQAKSQTSASESFRKNLQARNGLSGSSTNCEARIRKKRRVVESSSSSASSNEKSKRRTTFISSIYDEDCHEGNHTQVWGSFFNRDSNLWGYACCRSCSRSRICPLSQSGIHQKVNATTLKEEHQLRRKKMKIAADGVNDYKDENLKCEDASTKLEENGKSRNKNEQQSSSRRDGGGVASFLKILRSQ